MKSQIKQFVLGGLALVGLLVPLNAEADGTYTGYICETAYNPRDIGFGTYGYVYSSVYTGTNCGGSLKGYVYFCSRSASSSTCGNDEYLYRDAQTLVGLSQQLQKAAKDNMKTRVYYTGYSQGKYATFNYQ